ncbi:DUF3048 domain-containing protein, partial [Candidatus Viridilinea mediisalina]|uniref:DUF3048 domain-containing protein n=1 Tax=Candidatus Viridilinea mediisalina TaxID=2024553 RepID=UPI001FE5CB65
MQRLLLLVCFLSILTSFSGRATATAQAAAPTPSPVATRTPVATPVPTPPPLTLQRGSVRERPYVIMFDNHRDAYPQTGMNQAPLVIEALAEFGITRYMGIYVPGLSPELRTIGPVRSARSYFVEYAKGFRGVFVHAGGSPDALAMVANSVELVDMDALHRNAETFFRRSSDRFAPHNLFTSSAQIEAFLATQQLEKPSDLHEIGFLIKADAPLAQRPASQYLRYHFTYSEAYVAWSYDPSTNSYRYFRQQRPHIDGATGEQLSFKNVIVLEVPERPVPGDTQGRIQQNVIGEGAARIFMDGQMSEAVWRKGAGFAQLQLFDARDREVALNPGPIWIAAIPSLDHLSVEGGLVAPLVPLPTLDPSARLFIWSI